jgi:diacylglycerol kinase family enzyme
VWSPWIPRVTVTVDGTNVVEGRRGMVIVANSRQYAVRIDPACDASMADGLLDVVFLPAEGGVRAGAWLLSARLRRHRRNSTLIYRQGCSVRVTTEDRRPSYQVDGESGHTEGEGLDLGFTVEPRALRVLAPTEPA